MSAGVPPPLLPLRCSLRHVAGCERRLPPWPCPLLSHAAACLDRRSRLTGGCCPVTTLSTPCKRWPSWMRAAATAAKWRGGEQRPSCWLHLWESLVGRLLSPLRAWDACTDAQLLYSSMQSSSWKAAASEAGGGADPSTQRKTVHCTALLSMLGWPGTREGRYVTGGGKRRGHAVRVGGELCVSGAAAAASSKQLCLSRLHVAAAGRRVGSGSVVLQLTAAAAAKPPSRLLLPELLHRAADAGACKANQQAKQGERRGVGNDDGRAASVSGSCCGGQAHHSKQRPGLQHAHAPPSASFVRPTAVSSERPTTPARTGTWMPRGT